MAKRKRTLQGNELVSITHTNEDQGYWYDQFRISMGDCGLGAGDDMGELYRMLQREYGRCKSKIYIDTEGGGAQHIGWYFESREEYADAHRAYFSGAKTYLRGTWATLERATDLPPYETVPVS